MLNWPVVYDDDDFFFLAHFLIVIGLTGTITMILIRILETKS